ncbi:c-type cytochrome [Novosphingobium tardum]|uniref:c-type cytochrome n=1 Tax=Novosphingobium tardum TaxID=1538021 RepID=UPI0036D2614A
MRNFPNLVIAIALLLGACSREQEEHEDGHDEAPAAAEPASLATAAATPAVASAGMPPASFGNCAICHQAAPDGQNGIGPNLWGVYGRKAATGPYVYSQALQKSGLTWDDATLDAWIKSPLTLVPGTKMSFTGLADPAERAKIIAWLKTAR